MKAVVRAYVIDELLSGKPVGDDEDLLLSGLVDSIGVMRLVTYLEQTCGMEIPPQDVTIDNFVNIDAVTAYLEARTSA